MGQHFLQGGFKRRTIYDIIKRDEIGLLDEDWPRNGRPTLFNGKQLKRLKNAAAIRIGVSQRKRGKRIGVSQSTIHYQLKKVGLKYYKKSEGTKV